MASHTVMSNGEPVNPAMEWLKTIEHRSVGIEREGLDHPSGRLRQPTRAIDVPCTDVFDALDRVKA